MDKRILVVTSCTGEKKQKPVNQLLLDDFKDLETLKKRESELEKFTAGELYTGSQHEALMKGVRLYRNAGAKIDVNILSAGYGLIPEEKEIVPYEVTFNNMDSTFIRRWAKQQRVTEDLKSQIQNYDLIFFLLGDKYLQAIEWPIPIRYDQKLIFFAGESSKQRILLEDRNYLLSIGEKEAKKFKFGLIGIKGFLFAQLLTAAKKNPTEVWTAIDQDPSLIREYVLDTINKEKQLELFTEDNSDLLKFHSELYPVPDHLVGKNVGKDFHFFMPENDDRVDPNYDFLNDFSEKTRNPIENDVYAHQLYDNPQYDGILISKVNIDNATRKKRQLIEEMGIRKFLKLPEDYPIMGDCGAFSYIDKEEPPYKTEEVIQYYEDHNFNFGVSIDHLIFGPFQRDEKIRDYRYEITLENAKDFIRKHREMNCEFSPVGVVQGWDPESFRKAVQNVISLGYNRVALGGLAREKSEVIYEILKEISPYIPNEDFRLHLFGVARDMKTMRSFHKLGMTSFDSASPLRRAWLGTGHNYHTVEGKHYTAIRIPEASETSGRVKKMVLEGKGEFLQYKALEQKALTALRKFDNKEIHIDEALKAILEYDELLGENREAHEDLYYELLMERPWEKCTCPICRTIGIDVVIFRGNNRNRRRGFHNTYAYYCQVKDMRQKLMESIRNK